MLTGAIGRHFGDGEFIIRQGDPGDFMYFIQAGEVEVVQRRGEKEFCLATLKDGDVFGEMALFERELRTASVRAVGDVWVLTFEKKAFLKKVQQDPSLAFTMLEKMSRRVRDLNEALVRMGDIAYPDVHR